MSTLVEDAFGLDKRALGRLITLFEDARPEAAHRRAEALAEIAALSTSHGRGQAQILGITGTPGSGKSSLIGQVAPRMLDAGVPSLAVIAVDPSSPVSGGALLGDRTRVSFPAGDARLFFRSQASDQVLGGLGRGTRAVVRLLMRLFDTVLIETVGIGQSEADIRDVADRTYLVLQPLGGDELQFLKAGIMELPDAFIINKCDEERAARASQSALRMAMGIGSGGGQRPVFLTSCTKQIGLDELVADLVSGWPRGEIADKETRFFERWVEGEYGRVGLRQLQEHGGGAALIARAGGLDQAELSFFSTLRSWFGAAG